MFFTIQNGVLRKKYRELQVINHKTWKVYISNINRYK